MGIFSERDLMTRVVSKGLSPADTPVEQVMTTNPVVVDAQTSVEDCMRVMNQANCRHLPTVSGGKLVGMVSLRDLLLHNISQKDDEIQLMRAFIHYVPPSMPTGQESLGCSQGAEPLSENGAPPVPAAVPAEGVFARRREALRQRLD